MEITGKFTYDIFIPKHVPRNCKFMKCKWSTDWHRVKKPKMSTLNNKWNMIKCIRCKTTLLVKLDSEDPTKILITNYDIPALEEKKI